MATKYKPNPDNENCLEGIVCPQCGNTDHFAVEVKQFVGLTDNGADAHDDALNAAEVDSDIKYDDESAMVCVECKHHAKMGNFRPNDGLCPVGSDEIGKEAVNASLFVYFQPTDSNLLDVVLTSSSVWLSKLECEKDNDTKDISSYSGTDIESPFFEDLNSFHTTKIIIEALMKQSEQYVDGTDKGMDYAFCIIDQSRVDWDAAKDYILGNTGDRSEKDDAICDFESLMDEMASCRSPEQPLGAVYWNYNA